MFVKRPWFNVLLIICLALGGAAFQPAVSPHIALAEESIPPDEKNPPPSPSDADPLQEGLDALEQALSQGPEAVVALGRTLRGEALDIAMPDIVRAQGQLARSAPPPPEGQAISLEEEAAALQADQARAEAERAQALSLEANPAGDLPGFPAGPLPASSNPNAPTADLTVGSPPCTYPTIGAAMSAASNGDRLLLEGGVTFYENLSVQKSLTFQGGYNGCGSASSDRTTIDGSAAGRVMYIHDDLNITLQNLVVTNGSSTGNGAGILARSNTQLRGTNLDITGNTSTALGGGLCLLGATAVFTQTEIESNTAAAGAGVHAEFYNGYAPSLDLRSYADVSNNTASGNGGGVYMSQGSISLTDNSDIYNNTAIDGGGAYLITSTLTLAGATSEIMYNEASGNGGGLYALGSTINLGDQAELFYNIAGSDGTGSGGGAYLDYSTLWGDSAHIYYNQADSYGGGVYATNSSLLDMDLGGYPCSGPRCSQLSYNTASSMYGGGAYATSGSEIDLRQIFVENNQANLGGGLYASQSPVYLYNTLLARNNATGTAGDGLRLYTGVILRGMHNTFAYNNAGGAATGRAIDLFSATVDLSNSIIWGHASSLNDAAQTITYSDIQGGYAGTGNIDEDPLFIDPSAANFHIQHTSPAIDQCATGQTYDFDNELRPIIYARPSTPYDMGADEASARVGINGSACAYGRIQDAIDAAVPGDTIQASSDTFVEMLSISGKPLTIAGGYHTDCTTYITATTTIDAGGVGPVVTIEGSTLTLRSLNLTGGVAGLGGGLFLSNASSFVTLDKTDVYGNQAGYGGGIYINPSSTLTLTHDSDVTGNTATSDGGGVRLWGRLVGDDWYSQVSSNSAPNGGGISVPAYGAELVLAGAHVMDNQATAADGKGGGIHVYDGGSLTIANSSNVAGNTAYDGAGIYANNADLTFSSTVIHSNHALNYGGGLYLGGASSLSAENADMGDNYPSRGNTALSGAGIYLHSSSMDFRGHVYNNVASNSGGGIFATSSVITLTETELGGTLSNQPNQLETGGYYGAGMYLDNTQATVFESAIAGNTFQDTDVNYGGGAYIYGSTITFTNSSVAYNLATGSLTNGRGGGLYVSESSLTLDNTQVHDNAAGTSGGGIRLYNTSTINLLNGSELYNNMATSGDGGALAVAGSGDLQINVSDASFYQNFASGSGGAIDLRGTGILSFTGAWDLHHNTAGVDGGALAIYDTAYARFHNGPGYFSYNQAGGSGGAIYLNNNTNLQLYATDGSPITLQANTAGVNGGALVADAGGYFDIYGQVSVTGNSAPAGNGGAIHLSNGSKAWLDDYYIYGPSVDGNSAINGGAIYADGSPSVRCDGAVLSANSATNGSGGAIYLTASSSRAENCTFDGNTATLNGGAIAAYAGSSLNVIANLGSTTLAAEEAALPGLHNSIQATACNPADRQCSSFSANLADSDGDFNGYGGAIYNNDGDLSINQTYFHRNQAYAGGAIFQNGASASAVVTDTLIYSNTVTAAFGAGIRQSGGAFTVNHVTIAHNTGGSGFSAVAPDSYAAYNSIAWGNAGHSGFSQPTTSAECNIDEGGNAGLDQNPIFVAPGSGENYRLSDTSPAIDACLTGQASDLDGYARPVGAAYDMGAYEFDDHLFIAKSVSQPTFEPGQPIAFTLTLANQGSFAATHIVLTDTLTLLTGVTVNSTLTLTDTGHTPPSVWLVQDLPPMQSGAITIAGSLVSPLAAGTYTNTAFIAADGDHVGPNNTASVSFTVLNVAPTITTFPPGMANLDQLYTYEIHTLDRNGDLVSITAPTLPAWLTLTDHGDGTATLSGTPTHAHAGNHPVVLRVADTLGLYANQTFTITVSAGGQFYLPITFK